MNLSYETTESNTHGQPTLQGKWRRLDGEWYAQVPNGTVGETAIIIARNGSRTKVELINQVQGWLFLAHNIRDR